MLLGVGQGDSEAQVKTVADKIVHLRIFEDDEGKMNRSLLEVGGQVLVVSHKATIRLLVTSLLGFDSRGYRDRLDQLPCCLNILEFKNPVRARLMLFNDVSHYAGAPGPPRAHLSRWWDAGSE